MIEDRTGFRSSSQGGRTMVDASGQGLDGHQPNAIMPKDMRSFIFEREIAEVYLLLDFLSGRADKNLSNAFKGAGMPSIGVSESGKDSPPPPPISPGSADAAFTQAWIGAICSIKWPPEEPDKRPPSSLATTLLLAKDHLNSAAAPANGLSIAFSLMVAGDDEYRDERHARRRNYVARMLGVPRSRCRSSPTTRRRRAPRWPGRAIRPWSRPRRR